MSPSLRIPALAYVKSHVKNVKIPLLASGRFNVKPRIRSRFRTLKAELGGILEGRRRDIVSRDESKSLAAEDQGKSLDEIVSELISSDSTSLHGGDCKYEEESPTALLAEKCKDKDDTEVDTIVLQVDTEHGSPSSFDEDSPGGIESVSPHSSKNSEGINIQYLGGCSLKNHLNNAVVHAPPSLADMPTDGSLTCDLPEAEFTNSPVPSDIIDALDAFEVDIAISFSRSPYLGPARSLRTIWEEESAMFHSSCSVDSRGHPRSDAAISEMHFRLEDGVCLPDYPPTPTSSAMSIYLRCVASGVVQVERTP